MRVVGNLFLILIFITGSYSCDYEPTDLVTLAVYPDSVINDIADHPLGITLNLSLIHI